MKVHIEKLLIVVNMGEASISSVHDMLSELHQFYITGIIGVLNTCYDYKYVLSPITV